MMGLSVPENPSFWVLGRILSKIGRKYNDEKPNGSILCSLFNRVHFSGIRAPTHYVSFSQFWSHFWRTMHGLPQRLKSTLFEIFSNGVDPKGPAE